MMSYPRSPFRPNTFLSNHHAGITGMHHSTAARKVKLNRLLTVIHSSKNATFCTMFDFPMFQRSVAFVGSLLMLSRFARWASHYEPMVQDQFRKSDRYFRLTDEL